MDSSNRRVMLALGASFLLIMGWSYFAGLGKPPPTFTLDGGEAAAPQADAGVAAPVAAAPEDVDGGAPTQAELPPVQKLERSRDTMVLGFSTEGGGLTQAVLLGEKMREHEEVSFVEAIQRIFGKKHEPAPQMDVAVPPANEPLPLALAIDGAQPLSAKARYRLEEEGAQRLVMTASEGPWQVKKTFEWAAEGYELLYRVDVTNTGSAAAAGELRFIVNRGVDPAREKKGSMLGAVGNLARSACLVGDDIETHLPDDKPPKPFQGPIQWFGIDQQYFLTALFPLEGPPAGRCLLSATQTMRSADVFFPLSLGPGQSTTLRFGGYLGPKDSERLALLPSDQLKQMAQLPPGAVLSAPQLERSVDFGIWAVICKVLLGIMKFFHRLTHNWGVAIILLTVVVKLVLLPLTHKGMVAAEQMKGLQPKMEEIRKKFANDRERQNIEMMKLYQEAKVNPLGGCLPLLLQMPVWYALYATLRASFELYREPFISPIWVDLTVKDPTYILPVALGISMIITTKLQPPMVDPMQQKMMTYVLPVFFTVLMLSTPAGLALYIFTNNLLSIAQQQGLKRYLAAKKKVATA